MTPAGLDALRRARERREHQSRRRRMRLVTPPTRTTDNGTNSVEVGYGVGVVTLALIGFVTACLIVGAYDILSHLWHLITHV